MTDYVNKIVESIGVGGLVKKVVDHNREWFFAVVIIAIAAGCAFFQPTTNSPTDPEIQVTRSQLMADAEAYVARFEQAEADLDEKEQIRDMILGTASSLVGSIPGPWQGVAGIALTTLTAASALSANRKGRVITQLKAKKGK